MGRETSTQTWYVYTGPDAIRTDDGIRTNIEGDEDTARAFIASVGWLRRHRPIRHRLMPLEEYKQQQKKAEKPEPKPQPKPEPKAEAKVEKKAETKPEPKPKAKAKAKPKAKKKAD